MARIRVRFKANSRALSHSFLIFVFRTNSAKMNLNLKTGATNSTLRLDAFVVNLSVVKNTVSSACNAFLLYCTVIRHVRKQHKINFPLVEKGKRNYRKR